MAEAWGYTQTQREREGEGETQPKDRRHDQPTNITCDIQGCTATINFALERENIKVLVFTVVREGECGGAMVFILFLVTVVGVRGIRARRHLTHSRIRDYHDSGGFPLYHGHVVLSLRKASIFPVLGCRLAASGAGTGTSEARIEPCACHGLRLRVGPCETQ